MLNSEYIERARAAAAQRGNSSQGSQEADDGDLGVLYPMLYENLEQMEVTVETTKFRFDNGLLGINSIDNKVTQAKSQQLRELLGPNPSDPELARRLAAVMGRDGATIEDVLQVLDRYEGPQQIGAALKDLKAAARGQLPASAYAEEEDADADHRILPPPLISSARAVSRHQAPPKAKKSSSSSPRSKSPSSSAVGEVSPRSQSQTSSYSPQAPQTVAEKLLGPPTEVEWSKTVLHFAATMLRWAASAGLGKSRRCELAEVVLACMRPVAHATKALQTFYQNTIEDLERLKDQLAKGGDTPGRTGLCPGEDAEKYRIVTQRNRLHQENKGLQKVNAQLEEEIAGLRRVSETLCAHAARFHSVVTVAISDVEIDRVGGEYTFVDGAYPNGFPLWKQTGGTHWIYSGAQTGRWFVGDEQERGESFRCDSGIVGSELRHNGLPPPVMVTGSWQRLRDMEWVCDPAIVVTSPQADLRSTATPARTQNEIGRLEGVIQAKDEIIERLSQLAQQKVEELRTTVHGGPGESQDAEDAFEEIHVFATEADTELGLKFSGMPGEMMTIEEVTGGADGMLWAEREGLQVGDELVSVNGQLVSDVRKKDFKNMMRSRPLELILERLHPAAPAAAAAAAAEVPKPIPIEAYQQALAQERQRTQEADAGLLGVAVRAGPGYKVAPARRPPNWRNEAVSQNATAAQPITFQHTASPEVRVLGFTTVGALEAGTPKIVDKITPGTWAAATKMQPGDEVIKANGKELLGLGLQPLSTLLKSRPLTLSIIRQPDAGSRPQSPANRRADPSSSLSNSPGGDRTRSVAFQLGPPADETLKPSGQGAQRR
eukprot:TRINITY_DN9554_c0_g1_i1.p1 TRINITY_DN9554_c0_g1~~TRINITY_DN9554_c0_g1_i1.p1  ORF type:complete len:830 (-),score=201.21 TRINITY_DN9554_c0_g1_i1:43-2532(-)